MKFGKSVLAAAVLVAGSAGMLAGMAIADQPNMRNALDHLREARDYLQAASHNKGGHRVAAIRLVNEAIDHVQAGIDAGN
ncbi:MAG TPA: hypothetical protein PKY73_00955 [Hyphomonas sp.]|nr:hypothetical protein [Micropepsaceae bacterium]HRK66092.1 hypothetical protein [Hyphomonas sp.]